MLIDRIDKKLLNKIFPDGAGEIFYVNEKDMDFCDGGNPFWGKTFDDIPLPQWLPFEKFILHFSDSIVSYKTVHCEDPGCSCGSKGVMVDYFGCGDTGRIGSVISNGDLVVYWFDKSLKMTGMRRVNRVTRQQNDITWESYGMPDLVYCLFYYFLYNFLSFLSCKNVKTDFVEPTEKQQRNRRKKNKLPKVSYHVLKLKSTVAASNCSGESGLWSNRVHFCRGHVREYTDDRPLFGKVVGRFWIPPHVRGNRGLGVVQKDYSLCT